MCHPPLIVFLEQLSQVALFDALPINVTQAHDFRTVLALIKRTNRTREEISMRASVGHAPFLTDE
jgi:hypothetical protein